MAFSAGRLPFSLFSHPTLLGRKSPCQDFPGDPVVNTLHSRALLEPSALGVISSQGLGFCMLCGTSKLKSHHAHAQPTGSWLALLRAEYRHQLSGILLQGKLVILLHFFFFLIFIYLCFSASMVAQTVKNLPAMQETQVRSLIQEDPLLEEGMATYSSILAWRIPWTEEPGRLQAMGSQRVGHN